MKLIQGTKEEIFTTAATDIVTAIRATLQHKPFCALGIVGGRSIPALLEEINKKITKEEGTVHVFWLDERVHMDKNFTPTLPFLEQLANNIAVEWHPIVSTDQRGAQDEMERCLDRLAQVSGGPAFDVAILSAGEDGHVASLFPRHTTLSEMGREYVIVEDAPKPPPLRVTVTPTLLQTSAHAFLFFVGDKQHAFDMFMDDATPIHECPAKLLQSVPLHVYKEK